MSYLICDGTVSWPFVRIESSQNRASLRSGPFCICSFWRDVQTGLPDDEKNLLTHTIITTTSNEIVKPVHPNRMPAILAPESYKARLHGSEDDALALLRLYPADKMRIVREGIGVLKDG
jgi:putative SOS response-associated peptidase YedK